VSSKLGYRQDIDVLRAFAVLPVVLYHMDSTLVPGGYLGVDVFFVISGYLITSLLVGELANGNIDLLGFWRRRVLRIFPAMLLMVAVTFIVGQALLFAPERADLALNSAAAILSIGNISHWINYGGYWAASSEASPLLHTWSLGVEEQFYLFYPLLLIITYKFRNRFPYWVLPCLFLTSLSLFLYGADKHPEATFYLIPTRLWELVAGGIIATTFLSPMKALPGRLCSWSGLVLIATAYFMAPADALGIWNVVAVAGASLVVAVKNQEPFSLLGLNNRFFVFVGLISYSLYLWHYPIIVYADAVEERYGESVNVIVVVALMAGTSWFSWRFVEQPLRSMRLAAPYVLSFSVFAAIVVFSLQGWNSKEDLSKFNQTYWAGSLFDVSPGVLWPEKNNPKLDGMSPLAFSGNPEERVVGDPGYIDGITHYYGGDKIDALVLGDSHAQMWGPVLDQIMSELNLSVMYMVANGTEVFFDIPIANANKGNGAFTAAQLTEYRRARINLLQKVRPKVVIMSSRWRQSQIAKSDDLLALIRSQGAQIILIEDPPELTIGDRSAPQYFQFLGIKRDQHGDAKLPRVNVSRFMEAEASLRAISKRCLEFCEVLPTKDLYISGDDSEVKIISNNSFLYIDDDHLSVAGAALALERIKSVVESKFNLPKEGNNHTVSESNDSFSGS